MIVFLLICIVFLLALPLLKSSGAFLTEAYNSHFCTVCRTRAVLELPYLKGDNKYLCANCCDELAKKLSENGFSALNQEKAATHEQHKQILDTISYLRKRNAAR